MSDNGNNDQVIVLPANITVRELAQAIHSSPIDIIKLLMANGVMANINQQVDFDTAAVVAAEMGFEARQKSAEPVKEEETGEVPLWRRLIADEDPDTLVLRPPVVTILGHVDHGKTTLLDAIRHTDVAAGEVGGITQHIGAYQVEHNNRTITFLDTPGHAAFTAMRARGAQGADIVVLVVAADDGVMPQTKEAANHARAAKVPIIVALNKIDKSNADQERVKHQLSEIGLVSDEWGGDIIIVPMSAKKGLGLDDLLEAILLVADNIDIRANPDGRVLGTVIEAERDKARGVLSTLLLQNGTLSVGDVVVIGSTYGRLRAMFDHHGRKLRKAGPSTPVSVLGLNEVPSAGDLIRIVPNEREARLLVEQHILEQQQKLVTPKTKITLEQLFDRVQAGEVKELRLIIKADVQGSLEPIITSLNDLKGGEIGLNILHAETGNIGESDVMLAAASKAIVVGFSVQSDLAARRLAEAEGISIRLYDIIYRLLEDVEKALKGMLAPVEQVTTLGHAEVRAIFPISKVGNVAGCRVLDGEIHRNARIRVLRGGLNLYEGEIHSLRHVKEDVKEVRAGFECGITVKGFSNYELGDILECYKIEMVAAG